MEPQASNRPDPAEARPRVCEHRVLLLLEAGPARRCLEEWLRASCCVLPDAALDRSFDVCLLDAAHARRLEGPIRARREEEAPAFLPFLLVTGRVGPDSCPAAPRRLADEVIRVPLERAELETRIESLLHMRCLTLEMQKRSDEVAARLHRILDDSPSEIYLFDARSLRFVQVNEEACRNLGLSVQEVLRLTPLEIEANAHQYEDLLPLLRAGQEPRLVFETEHRRRDGSQYPVEVRLRLSQAESPPVFVAVVQDISERRHAERRIEEAHERALQAEVDRRDFSRELLRSVTHDRLQLVDAVDIPEPFELLADLPVRDGPEYRQARIVVRDFALEAGMDGALADDLLLATGEAIGNCLKHAVDGRCRVYREPDRMIVRVSDRGVGIRWQDLPASILTPGFSTKVSLGLGYTLMLKLLDRVWLSTSPRGTIIQMEKSLRPVPDADEIEFVLQAMDRF